MLSYDHDRDGAPAGDTIQAVKKAYDRGRYLDALGLAQPLGPLGSWRGPEASVLAMRLAAVLGAPTLAASIARRSWREFPDDDKVAYFHAIWRRHRVPPVEMRERLAARRPAMPVLPDWLALEAQALAGLRDFEPAHALLDEAMRLDPRRAWLLVERASVLMQEDRHDEALESVLRALEMRPAFRPAVEFLGEILTSLGRDDEALDELGRAAEVLQHSGIHWQRANLLVEKRRHHEARAALDAFQAHSPLLEPRMRAQLAARRSDIAAELGQTEESLAQAALARSRFHRKVVENARQAPAGARRIVLDVPFVRQHRITCGPATLTALARFWGRDAQHLEVVEEICYDGTSMDAERNWAESHGFAVREFNVTWESAVALIERGIPFTLATIEPGSGHLQAVIGVDEFRGTLLIRDPSHRSAGEMLAGPGLDRYRFTGPRGMAMVPAERADLFDGLSLPDEALRESYHQLSSALRRHDREAAFERFRSLEAAAPEHDLVIMARLSLAAYDEDEPSRLAATEALARRHPKQVTPLLWELGLRRNLSVASERKERLEVEAARLFPHPHVLMQLAQELLADARHEDRAERLLKLALLRAPYDAMILSAFAELHSRRREHDRALVFQRWAACLDDRDEFRSRSWFWACHRLGRSDEALAAMRRRFERLGARSPVPARALVASLLDLERTSEALDVLGQALRLRPADGELRLYSASVHIQVGDLEAARASLEEARGQAPRRRWLQVAAQLAQLRGEPLDAIALLRELIELAPAAVDTNDAVARLLAATEGPSAALAHVAAVCGRFPHHRELLRSRLGWLARWELEGREDILREAVAQDPDDAWLRRELALQLSRQGRHVEALAEVDHAAAIEPHGVGQWNVRADILIAADRVEEGRAALRRSLELDASNEWGMSRLLGLPVGIDERREDLAFVLARVTASPVALESLGAWRQHAVDVLEPSEILESLRSLHAAFPASWTTWCHLALQLNRMDRVDEATELAVEARARFPHLPYLSIVRSFIERARGDHDAAREALEEALRMNPSYETASLLLAGAFQIAGRFEDELRVLEQAMARDPHRSPVVSLLVARLLRRGRIPEAMEILRRFVDADPQADPDWDEIEAAARESGQIDAALEIARDLARRRPGLTSSWMAVARVAGGAGRVEEQVDALRHAVMLAPRAHEPRDMLGACLASLGRHDEALAAVRAPDGSEISIELEGRAAWIEWMRGRRIDAIRRMRGLLERSPRYIWGWSCLQWWLEETNDVLGRARVAETLARLQPMDPRALRWLADVRMASGDREGALGALRRAALIVPDDAALAHRLVTASIEDGDPAGALAALDRVRPHLPPGAAHAWRAQVELSRGDVAAASDALRAAAAEPDLPQEHAVAILDAMLGREGGPAFVRGAWRIAASARDNPGLAGALAITLVTRTWWRDSFRLLHRLPAGSPSWHAVLQAILDGQSEGRSALRLRFALWRHARQAREDITTWAKIGWFHLAQQHFRTVLRVMRDWRERTTLGSWMLLNPALAAWSLGRRKEAVELSRRALELHDDDIGERHRVLLALDALVSGRIDEVRALRERMGEADIGGMLNYIRTCLDVALLARGEGLDAAERRTRWNDACKRIASLGSPGLPVGSGFHRPMFRARAAAIRLVARECGGLPARLWALLAPFMP